MPVAPTLPMYPAPSTAPTTREGQTRGEPWLVKHVRDEAVDELGREPCGLGRHDAARVRDRHDVAHLRRVEHHGCRHFAAADVTDEFIHPATAADICQALISAVVRDPQDRLQKRSE